MRDKRFVRHREQFLSKFFRGRAEMITRILVTDNGDVVRRGTRQLLRQRADWQVCGEAADGQEAVEKVRQLAPDVVVLDFSMPNMNGIDAARQIRAIRPRWCCVLCILIGSLLPSHKM
jgi:DNA-binding NarL/FixJ family response regulator